MPRCKHCKEKFEPKQFNRKYCYKDECIQAAYEYAKKKLIDNAKKEKSRQNIDLMSKDKYRATKIQPLINKLVRIIDHNQKCIATGNGGKMSAGHRHSVGSSRNLSLNLHNIHIQSYQSNSMQAGDHVKYRQGIIKTYSREYANFIDEVLTKCPSRLWDKQKLQELRPIIQKKVNELEKLSKQYTAKERLQLRNELNEYFGLYPKEFSIYTLNI